VEANERGKGKDACHCNAQRADRVANGWCPSGERAQAGERAQRGAEPAKVEPQEEPSCSPRHAVLSSSPTSRLQHLQAGAASSSRGTRRRRPPQQQQPPLLAAEASQRVVARPVQTGDRGVRPCVGRAVKPYA